MTAPNESKDVPVKEELKPCPFCGQTDYLSQKETRQRTPVVYCSFCTMEWVSKENWQNAYCWEDLKKLEGQYQKVLSGNLSMQKKISDLESRIKVLTETMEDADRYLDGHHLNFITHRDGIHLRIKKALFQSNATTEGKP